MTKKITRLLSMLVVLVMFVGVFSACGSSEDKTSEVTTSPSTTNATAGTEKDEGYVPTKDLELVVWNTQGTDQQLVDKPKEDIPGDWLAKKTRVTVKEYYGNGGQQWEPKLTTLIASGNLPHLVITQSGQGVAHFAKLHEGDLNWELTPEMIQKYAPDIWKFVPQYIWDSAKIEGKIYGILSNFIVSREIDPNLSDYFIDVYSTPKDKIGTYDRLMIRDDILKKLIPSAMNYEEVMKLINEVKGPIGDRLVLPIKSTDEYVKFMYDIKALGLKEGNKPVYAFGYDGGDNWGALSCLGADMLGYKGYYYTGWLNIPEKKMDFGYLNPTFKEAAKIQNKMINDKVIDPESLVHTAEKFKEKFMNGQYAIIWSDVTGYGDISVLNQDLKKAGKTFQFVPFFTEVPQRAEFPHYQEGPPSFLDSLSLLKTIKEEDVPQVLNWVNTMFTEEWEEIKFWGTKEAGLYEELPDGKRKFKDEKLQKFMVDQDFTAMDWKDAKGLAFNGAPGGSPGFWYGIVKWAYGVSEYSPQFFNKAVKYSSLNGATLKVPASSPYTKGFIPVPNVQSWSPEYANIPEVQKLWSTRATWDDPFKIAFTAKNEEEFIKKWDAAIENFRKTIDVDKMLDEQTKIMLPLLEKRTAQAK